jgi:hypothetical protein
MLAKPSVIAPVLSQLSVPVGRSAARKRDTGMSEETWAQVKSRIIESCPVMALRFTGDVLVPGERFERLRQELGERFLAVEIPSPNERWGLGKQAHSVLTEEIDVQRPDHPATRAVASFVDFLSVRLGVEIPTD